MLVPIKAWLGLICAFAFSSSLVFAADQTAPTVLSSALQTNEQGIVLQPYLQNPARDGITIMWRTAKPAYGWVEYGESELLDHKEDLVIDGLRNANTVEHRVRLHGLSPDQSYFYRVCFKPIKSFATTNVVFEEAQYTPLYRFKLTGPETEKITCCFFNDLHNKYPTFEKLLTGFRTVSPDCVFFNGDCFLDPSNQVQILKALQVYAKGVEAANRPALFVRGNHETRGGAARLLKGFLDYPDGQYYFACSMGPVRFVVLDCGEYKPEWARELSGLVDFSAYRQAEAEWLRKEMKSKEFKQASYRILVHHMPLYGPGSHRVARKLWQPVLKRARFDLAISGHTHNFALVKTGKFGNPYPLLIGGGPEEKRAAMIVLKAESQLCQVTLQDIAGKTLFSVFIPKNSARRKYPLKALF